MKYTDTMRLIHGNFRELPSLDQIKEFVATQLPPHARVEVTFHPYRYDYQTELHAMLVNRTSLLFWRRRGGFSLEPLP